MSFENARTQFKFLYAMGTIVEDMCPKMLDTDELMFYECIRELVEHHMEINKETNKGIYDSFAHAHKLIKEVIMWTPPVPCNLSVRAEEPEDRMPPCMKDRPPSRRYAKSKWTKPLRETPATA